MTKFWRIVVEIIKQIPFLVTGFFSIFALMFMHVGMHERDGLALIFGFFVVFNLIFYYKQFHLLFPAYILASLAFVFGWAGHIPPILFLYTVAVVKIAGASAISDNLRKKILAATIALICVNFLAFAINRHQAYVVFPEGFENCVFDCRY